MANVQAVRNFKPVHIELGGKTRTLQFDMNAFSVLEHKFGSVDKAMDELQKGRMQDLKLILWAGLIHEEIKSFDEETGEPTAYNITPYTVGSWIANPLMMQEVSSKLAEAMGADLPEQSETGATETKNA